MNNTAPKWMGILAVAALFGVVAWVASFVVFNLAAFAAILVGGIVGLVTAFVLWLGWRDPADRPIGAGNVQAKAESGAKAAAARVAEGASAAAETAKDAAGTAKSAASKAVATAKDAAATAAKATDDAVSTAKDAADTAADKAQAGATKAAKGAKAAADKTEGAAKAATAVVKSVAADGKPEMLSQPRGGAGDDLKQIKGVGPKLEKMLNTMGVWHFDQVASWRKKEVEWVDDNLEGFKGRVARDEWVKQAKVLAKGGTTEFSKKVKKGGVY